MSQPDACSALAPVPERMSESEAARLLAWSGDVVPAGYDGPGLDAALASAFATHGGRVAVSDEAGEIDFAQLDARSAALALALAAAGVRPGDRVGVSLDRSAALIVLLVAVIRAGASYVPLDPDYPDERLQLMVQDAAPVLVVGEGSPPAWATGCDWIELADGTLSRDGQQVVPGTAALPARDGGTPAYVIYTSGSTGRPKGVVVPDRAVERLVRDTNYVEITPDDVLLQLAPVAFDASTFEIWGALLSGARLEVAPPGRVGLDTIAELIVGRAVSVLWLTAPLFHLMVDEEGDALARLRVLLAGGDALSATHVARYLAHPARQGVLVNGYGPTEATTFSCCHVMAEDGDASRPGGVPIGRPIARSSAQVLDALGRRVALGTVGELCVGGMGLAHGYAGDARRTAERFVPDPQVPGGRLYRTGDRVRWLEDGVLAFLGRADRQVKVRGHRVEPGEIEAALQTHPAVGNAAVALREGPAGSARLVAWVAPSGDALPDAAELRRYLDDRLPPYAVPTLFSVLERLPLTANGKVDVRALPDPEAGDAAGGAGAAAQEDSTPQGPVEQTLATIWGEVLGRDSVGRHDNFFELGGDSILSIQIKGLLRQHGWDGDLAALFAHPLLADYARTLKPYAVAPSDVGKSATEYPLAALQKGMLFHAARSPGSGTYHDLCTFYFDGALDPAVMQAAIIHLGGRHPILKTAFDLDHLPEPVQRVDASARIPVTFTDWSDVPGAEQGERMAAWQQAEQRKDIDWSTPPLMAMFLHRLSPTQFAVSLSFHHAILDGWSVASFVAQLIDAYQVHSSGPALEAPAVNNAFADFIKGEGRSMRGGTDRAFWTAALSDADISPLREYRCASASTFVVERCALPISPPLSDALERKAADLGVPLKSVLLAAHVRAQSELLGRADVVTGLVSHGRPETTEAFEALGVFLNTLPLRLKVSELSGDALVRAVFEQEQCVWPHRLFPYIEVCRAIGQPDFLPAAFNFTNFHILDPLRSATGIRLTGRDVREAAALPMAVQGSFDRISGRVAMAIEVRSDSGWANRSLDRIAEAYLSALEHVAGDHAPEQTAITAPADDLYRHLARRFAAFGSRIAIDDASGRLTYDQLERRIGGIAAWLVEQGVGVQDRVLVALPPSADQIATILALWKLGAVYVPVATNEAPQRLRAIAGTVRPRVAIASPAAGDAMIAAVDSGIPVTAIPPHAGAAASGSSETVTIHPDAAAYVIFTSGSTGIPKGVVIHRRGMLNVIERYRDAFGIDAHAVVTQLAPTVFDASLFESLPALANGARVVVVDERDRANPEAVAAVVRSAAATVVTMTPTMLSWLDTDILPRGIKLICVGEPLPEALAARWVEHVELFNAYGPSETSIWATSATLVAPLANGVHVGSAIDGVTVRIVDDRGEVVADGQPGRLEIGGVAPGHGYLGDPRRTAAMFRPDPLSRTPGGRIYDTGDLALQDLEGRLFCRGRADRQVKVRGNRIELGEVEHALHAVEGVRAAAAFVVPDRQRLPRLVAAVALADPTLTRNKVLARLGELLPARFLPDEIRLLEELPMTRNNKVDVAALASPMEPSRSSSSRSALLAVFAEVFGKQVAPDADFFALGGDSITAISFCARAKKAGVPVSLDQLFRHPTPAALTKLIEAQDRQDAGAGNSAGRFELISDGDRARLPSNVRNAFPLMRMQAGMLFHWEQCRQRGVYFDIVSYRVRGRIERGALETSIGRIVAKHAALRTAFELSRFEEPLQLVYATAEPMLDWADLSDRAAADQEQALADWQAAELDRPLDLSRPGLVKFGLHKLAETLFQLSFSFPHAIADGWSVSLLVVDLLNDLAAGSPAPVNGADREATGQLQEEAVQLERAALTSPDARRFWEQRLQGVQAAPIAEDRGGGVRSSRRVTVDLDEATATGLKAVAAAHGLSVKHLLLAVHLAVVSQRSGSDTVLTGIVTNGRPESEGGEHAVGLFLNTLPLAHRIGSSKWSQLAEFAQDWERQSMQHRRYPLAAMLDLLPQRKSPDTLFNFTSFRALNQLDRSAFQIVASGGFEYSDYALTCQAGVDPANGRARLLLDIDQARISDDRLVSIVTSYQLALRLLVDDVDGRCDAGELLGASEAARLLAWSGDVVPAGYDGPGLDAALASAFATHSGRVAVSDEAGEIDFAQLDARSAALALALAAAGVRPGDRVGVSLDRSAALIVLLVAVIRAGASYVPLDPDYPDERLQLMVQDAAPVLVVGEGSPPAWATGCDWIELADGTLSRDGQQVVPGTAALPARDGGTPAYVIYTSGSTGRPKGVVVPDRAVERLVRDTNYVEITPDDVLLQLAPVAFDASTFEIWGALLSGARLEVAPPGRVGLDTIAELIVGRAVSVLWLTAPLFHLMVDEEGDALARLRVLLAGGDALSATHVARYLAHPARQGVLVNGYGPTEATTFSCCHVMAEDGDASRPGGVPIGRPIARSSAQVLDALGRRVALGTVGELCVGGMGLAHGYAGDARRTAERFVPDPQVPGGRLYRTGDRVRWLEDGVLAFLGRADRQVKVRGHRVEPGEIEAALQTHPAVGNAAVALREGPAGSARLVAWVAPSGDALPDAAELRRYLDDRLPPYAVPTLFSVLERLPLTANGKVDVRALPDPEAGDAAGGAGAAAQEDSTPQGPVEQTLATIWGEVLGRDSVGRHDNFFELGGDSILSIQIKARAADRGVDFALEDLFERQTVAALAEVVRDTGAAPADTPAAVQPFELVDADDLKALRLV